MKLKGQIGKLHPKRGSM